MARVGSVSPMVSLQDVRRSQWEDRQKARLRDIEERKKHGAGNDESTPWPDVAAQVESLKGHVEAHRNADVRDAATSILVRVAPKLEPLSDYEESEAIAPVRLSFRILDVEEEAKLRGAFEELALGYDRLPFDALRDRLTTNAVAAKAQGQYVARAVAAIEGIDGGPFSGDPLPQDAIDSIIDEKILTDVYVAAREWQSMRPFVRARFSSWPPTICPSPSSTAASAPSEVESGRDATRMGIPSSEPAPGSSLDAAHVGTSSTIPTPPGCSSSTAAPTAGRSDSTTASSP